MVGSVIYTFLNSYVTQYTVYWPLTMGIIIFLIVRFLPGGLLSVIGEKIVVSPDCREPHEAPHTTTGIDKGGNS
jgi:hypothetical protein